MGVECTVSISGANSPVVVQQCLDTVTELENLWSRFIPLSDICRLNEAQGTPIFVDARTIHLVQHMVSAFSATQGMFNPTMLPLQIAAGDTHSLVDNKTSQLPAEAHAWSDLSGIHVHDDGRLSLPPTMTLDAGGIAKGFAADLIKQKAISLGAIDVCVNLGGDISCATQSDSGWRIDILSPIDRRVIDTVTVHTGGIASSAINARNRNGFSLQSHIFSSTAEPFAVGASVLADTAAWAEAWTKFAVLTLTETALQELEALGLAALIVASDGSVHKTTTWKDFIL